MLEVLFDSILSMPRSLVLRLGYEWDGEERSWTVPIYILNNEFLDIQPGDEDPLPPNNENPHPFQDDEQFMDIEHNHHQENQAHQQQHQQVWPEWDQAAMDLEQGGQAAPVAQDNDPKQESGLSSASVNNRVVRRPAQPMVIQVGIPDLNLPVGDDN